MLNTTPFDRALIPALTDTGTRGAGGAAAAGAAEQRAAEVGGAAGGAEATSGQEEEQAGTLRRTGEKHWSSVEFLALSYTNTSTRTHPEPEGSWL